MHTALTQLSIRKRWPPHRYMVLNSHKKKNVLGLSKIPNKKELNGNTKQIRDVLKTLLLSNRWDTGTSHHRHQKIVKSTFMGSHIFALARLRARSHTHGHIGGHIGACMIDVQPEATTCGDGATMQFRSFRDRQRHGPKLTNVN
jgi:hypothetical protein